MTNIESDSPIVVVTGANGLVGSGVCAALIERGAHVRALVRRAGTAPAGPRIREVVGDFTDDAVAARALSGASAVVSTAHPLGSDRATQHRVAVAGTTGLAHTAVAAGVRRMVHTSTAAVYDRSPGVGDVDEASALVGDDGGDYGVAKRDADLALAAVEGIGRVIVRPPAILGPGPTSVWNTLRPGEMRESETARHAVAAHTFAWVHRQDLCALVADLASGRVPDGASADPDDGPPSGGCVVVNVAGEPAIQRDYYATVCAALGVEPIWDDDPAWTGRLLTTRAAAWGWTPNVTLAQALEELASGLGDPG